MAQSPIGSESQTEEKADAVLAVLLVDNQPVCFLIYKTDHKPERHSAYEDQEIGYAKLPISDDKS
jgi:hypothetical protein